MKREDRAQCVTKRHTRGLPIAHGTALVVLGNTEYQVRERPRNHADGPHVGTFPTSQHFNWSRMRVTASLSCLARGPSWPRSPATRAQWHYQLLYG
jgi:hypothetical protein